MSVAMTIDQVRDRTKTVTRRHAATWNSLAPGDGLTLVEKGQGLAKGERQVIVAEVLVIDVRVEPLGLVDAAELVREGFPGADPGMWRVWWAGAHGYRIPAGLEDPDEVLAWVDGIEVRRIEWIYPDAVRDRDGAR